MTAYLQTAGWALIHFVWQGAAIAGAVSLLLRLTRRRSASARYVIACAGLAAMLAAPAVTARLMWTATQTPSGPLFAVADADVALTTASAVTTAVKTLTPAALGGTDAVARIGPAIERVLPGITIAWLIGVVLLLLRLTGGWWHVRRLHRAALASPSSRWQTACRRLAYRLGLPAAAHVVESALVDVPTVVGWLRPAILLPIAALAALSPAQVEAILAHELAHIRRHDYAVNVLQTLAETLLFYHPAVWWLSKRIRAEREHCCDDIAIAICGDPVGYAQALAELESWRTVPAGATIAMAATGGSLLDRVRRILQVPITDEPRSPSWAVTLALTVIFTAGAGGVQHLPWTRTQGDARAESFRLESTHAAVAPAQARPARPAMPLVPAIPASRPDFDDPLPPAPPSPSPDSPPAPPAPPSPPAPPAPPAPAASRDFSVSSHDSEWRMSWSDNGHKLDVRLHGTVAFTDDLTDVQSLSDGGMVSIRSWDNLVPHTVEIAAANGAITRTYFVAGLKRPWDDEAKRFLATQLPILVRQSGFGAESRVKSIFGKKGVGGVLEEIDLLGGDYARRLYMVALIDLAGFNSTTVQPLLQRVGQSMKSDYDRRQVLEHIASNVTLDQQGAAAYVQAMSTMRSDYDQREALTALTRRNAAVADGETLLPALAHMKSSYDKRVTLEQILARGSLSTEGKRTVLTAAAGIASDYDRRQVLTAYLKRFGVEPALRDEFFAAVRAIRSDYDAAEVLLAAVAPGIDASTRPAFVAAAERITSSHDQNRVLAALVKAERR